MVEKRAAEQNGQGPDAKKARPDGPAATSKPALNLAALQRAKALLEKQKQLKEKLKNLPQVTVTFSCCDPSCYGNELLRRKACT